MPLRRLWAVGMAGFGGAELIAPIRGVMQRSPIRGEDAANAAGEGAADRHRRLCKGLL